MRTDGKQLQKQHEARGRVAVQRGQGGKRLRDARAAVPALAAAGHGALRGVRVLDAAGGRRGGGPDCVRAHQRGAVPDESEAREGGVPAHPADAAVLQRGGARGRHAQAADSHAAAAAETENVDPLHGTSHCAILWSGVYLYLHCRKNICWLALRH